MAGVFPQGPVRDFFFKSLAIGIPTFSLNLGFATLTFGLSFAVTTVAALLVVLAVYLWYKF
jgi:presenilin-like A22 family membrane protease